MSGSWELFNLKKEEKEFLDKELLQLQNGNNEIAEGLSEITRKRQDLVEKNIKLYKENCNLKNEIRDLQKMNKEIEEVLGLLENSEIHQKDLKEKSDDLMEDLTNFMGEKGNEFSSYEELEESEAMHKEWTDKLADIENKIAEGEKSDKEETAKKEAEIQKIMDNVKNCIQRKVEAENETMQLSGYCEDLKKAVETKTQELLELQNYRAELQSQVTAVDIPSKKI